MESSDLKNRVMYTGYLQSRYYLHLWCPSGFGVNLIPDFSEEIGHPKLLMLLLGYEFGGSKLDRGDRGGAARHGIARLFVEFLVSTIRKRRLVLVQEHSHKVNFGRADKGGV